MTSAAAEPTLLTTEEAPTTAAPSSEVVAKAAKPNKKNRKKRQRSNKAAAAATNQQLQTMITQLKQLCSQVVGQQATPDNKGSPISMQTGVRIPASVWRPQPPQPERASRQQSRQPAASPPKEVRLTAAERATLNKDQAEKELRARLRSAVTRQEFEELLGLTEKAGMTHEANLTRRKLERLLADTAATTTPAEKLEE